MAVKKYFLAIVIPAPLFEQIEAIKQALYQAHGLKGALRSPAHITLHRPFEWKEEKETLLIEKLSRFAVKKDFEIELNGFAFFEPRVIYVNVLLNAALEELHTHLKTYAQRELQLFNEAEDLRGFHPHVTVANRDLKKPKFYELQPEFASKPFHGVLMVSHFSLLKLEKTWQEYRQFS